jgi:hypothetical protein
MWYPDLPKRGRWVITKLMKLFKDHRYFEQISENKMSINIYHEMKCAHLQLHETSTAVLDRLNVIIDRLNVISSGSVIYMRIVAIKSMFPRGPPGSNI